MSPFPAEISEVARQFATSQERIEILVGLLDFREALAMSGIDDGFQWLDGSFVENVEHTRGRPPKDVDVVTIAHRPGACASPAEWNEFVASNAALFDPTLTKSQFRCDAYFIDLDSNPKSLVNSTRYWFGLFSHQRSTALWKGMLQIPLRSDDEVARSILTRT